MLTRYGFSERHPILREYVQGGDAQTTDCVALDFPDAMIVRSVV
jgi:hypothetical protein